MGMIVTPSLLFISIVYNQKKNDLQIQGGAVYMPANLVFYPYQLEDGSYIDKVSGKKLSMYGTIDKYPANITPYKTPKNYIGGGGIYKTESVKDHFVYYTSDIFTKQLTNFTIYYWAYKVSDVIFTIDDSQGYEAFSIAHDRIWYGTGDILAYHNSNTNNWAFYEFTFKKSGSNYFITCFYNGTKQYSGNLSSHYINQHKILIGNWDYPPAYWTNGMLGYIYDLSIYDDILHTENYNYNSFPTREMHYKINYTGMQNENDMYGIKNNE